MMLLRADTRYSQEEQLRRDDLRNHLYSFKNNNSGVNSESSNVWDALPGSKFGSCTDLLNGPKSRPLPKALQPKSPKDEQRSFSFSYRAPVLALPPTLPLTKAPRRMESSDLYENQRHSMPRARISSFGGFPSQTLSSAANREADKDFFRTNGHIKMSRHEASSPERYVSPYPVTLQRPESPCGTKSTLPGTAQEQAQMLWIEKVRRGSEPYSEYAGREPLPNNKGKEAYVNDRNKEKNRNHIETVPYRNNPTKESNGQYLQEEHSRNSAQMEPHWNSKEKEQIWNDANKKLYSSYTESEPYCNTGVESHLSNNGKMPFRSNEENESHWKRVEVDPRLNYSGTETRWTNRENEPNCNKLITESHFTYAGTETGWGNQEKELGLCWANLEKALHYNGPAKELGSWNNMEKESQCNNRDKYSSGFNHVDGDATWKEPETQARLRNSEGVPYRNNNGTEQSTCDAEKEQHWNNSQKQPYASYTKTESRRNITAKEPDRNGEEMTQRLNKEAQLNSSGSQWNSSEKGSSWNNEIKAAHWANSEEYQHERPNNSTILPSRYTHTAPSACLCKNQSNSSVVEPPEHCPQVTPLTQHKASSGGELLRLETSPLYKLSSFRYGSGRESSIGVRESKPTRTDDIVCGWDLSQKTSIIDGKAKDSQASGRTSRDRALSQGNLPRLLNKYLSGSATDLSRGYDSGERPHPPRTSDGRSTNATSRGANQVSSNAMLISDRSRKLDRGERTLDKYVAVNSVQTPSALHKTRNRWASLDREGQGVFRRDGESSPHNASQLIKERRSIFEDSRPKPETEKASQKREASSRPSSCLPFKQAPRPSTTAGKDRETKYSDYRSRARSYGNLSPSSRYLYGSETNLASIGSRQDPSYLAMTSSKYPSARYNDQDSNAIGSERYKSETLGLSSSRLNQAEPPGTLAPHCISSIQLTLMPQCSDFHGSAFNGQTEDVTRSKSVSSIHQVEPTTESSTGTLTFVGQYDSKSQNPSVISTEGVGSKPTRKFGTIMAVTAYPWEDTKTQISDGNLTEDSGIGVSDTNIRSSSASPREDLRINRDILMDGDRLVSASPADPTTSSESPTLHSSPPFVGQSTGVSSLEYSGKYYVRGRPGEKEENGAKEIFTKQDWISNVRMTGKSPTPVENRALNLRSDDRRTEAHRMEANAQGSDRSAPPGEWRAPLGNRGANARDVESAISSTEQPVKQQCLSSVARTSTAAKWKEFLSGSVEMDIACKVPDQQNNECRKNGTITIGESLGQGSGGQWNVDPQWTKKDPISFQLPVESKESSRTTGKTAKESTFDADVDNLRRDELIVSKPHLERMSTSDRSSVRKSSNMEDKIRRGDTWIEDTSQGARGSERHVENCSDEVQGLREVEIYVQRGALGVGFCVEGGLESTTGDKPITIKRIFAGADGHLRGKLRTGDAILRVNDKDFRQMTHYNAWNFLKTLPEGPAKLLIFTK